MSKDVLTIHETVARSKAEGIPVTEYTLRAWIKRGDLPVRKIGTKSLIYWPNLIAYLSCADGGDNANTTMERGKIRRLG